MSGWERLEPLGHWLYMQCVDFMVLTANLLGVTYRDTNSAMFFLLWPAVTVGLMSLATWQAVTLWRLRRALATRATPNEEGDGGPQG